jgi:hypothetical protein
MECRTPKTKSRKCYFGALLDFKDSRKFRKGWELAKHHFNYFKKNIEL